LTDDTRKPEDTEAAKPPQPLQNPIMDLAPGTGAIREFIEYERATGAPLKDPSFGQPF